jgi:hypothetical protein
MIVCSLLLLLLAAAAPLADRPLRRLVTDPVLPVAALSAVALALASWLAAAAGDAEGWERAAAAVLGVLVAVTAGSHVVRAVFRLTRGELRLARPGAVPPPAHAPDDASPDEPPLELESSASVLRGGAWIGYLERGAVTAALLADFPEGLALVLAVKGVGRYPELRDARSGGRTGADAPEEFIIGTLASLLWAAAAAGSAALLR